MKVTTKMGSMRRTIEALEKNRDLDNEKATKVAVQLEIMYGLGDSIADAIYDLTSTPSVRPFGMFEDAIDDFIQQLNKAQRNIRDIVGIKEA